MHECEQQRQLSWHVKGASLQGKLGFINSEKSFFAALQKQAESPFKRPSMEWLMINNNNGQEIRHRAQYCARQATVQFRQEDT